MIRPGFWAVTVALLPFGCSDPIAFPCCNEHGLYVYTEVPDGGTLGPERQGVVLQAMRDGVIPADLDVDTVGRFAAYNDLSPSFWKAIYANAEAYAQVAALATEAGQEPMIAAYPFVLSRFRSDFKSMDCADGPWQLELLDPRVEVGSCRAPDEADAVWTREQADMASMIAGRCRITRCLQDERKDLEISTRAVLASGPVPGDRHVAAGVHLLAVCVVPVLAALPAYCERIEVPTRDQVDPPEKRR